jgi:phosphohistidine phosphatase
MSCTLYVMRHGIAEDAQPGQGDEARALTEEGLRKTRAAAAGLRQLGVAPQLILTSPLRRAVQTAEIVADVLDSGKPEIFPQLAPGYGASETFRHLPSKGRLHQVFLVGHQPDLGELAAYLLTGDPHLAPLPFKKAAVAAIAVDALPPTHGGLLEWFLTGRQLRAIGRDEG